jgi:hypothetical protein
MPRQYGLNNAPQYTSSPAIGPAGNLYYDTTTDRLYVSDGTIWAGLDMYKSIEGWTTCAYPTYVSHASFLHINDSNIMVNSIPKGTRFKITYGGTPYYGVVGSCASSASGAAANPLINVSLDATTDFFTYTAHGLVNGDQFWFPTSWNPTGVSANVGFWVVNATANTFQCVSAPTGAVVNFGTSRADCRIQTGTAVNLVPNGDYPLTRGAVVTLCEYSYAMSPPGYPGWFNYTIGQAANNNPLTWTGYSTVPSGVVYQFRVDGNMVTYAMRDTTLGTSNAVTTTMTLPVSAMTLANAQWVGFCRATDNGTGLATPAVLQIASAGTTVSVFKDSSGLAWTASGFKGIRGGMIQYPI